MFSKDLLQQKRLGPFHELLVITSGYEIAQSCRHLGTKDKAVFFQQPITLSFCPILVAFIRILFVSQLS